MKYSFLQKNLVNNLFNLEKSAAPPLSKNADIYTYNT